MRGPDCRGGRPPRPPAKRKDRSSPKPRERVDGAPVDVRLARKFPERNTPTEFPTRIAGLLLKRLRSTRNFSTGRSIPKSSLISSATTEPIWISTLLFRNIFVTNAHPGLLFGAGAVACVGTMDGHEGAGQLRPQTHRLGGGQKAWTSLPVERDGVRSALRLRVVAKTGKGNRSASGSSRLQIPRRSKIIENVVPKTP